MFKFLGIMLAGMAVGMLLKKKPRVRQTGERLIIPVICLLLFVMGVAVGANREVMQNLPTLGLDAAIITAGCLLGSCVAAWYVWHRFIRKREDGDA